MKIYSDFSQNITPKNGDTKEITASVAATLSLLNKTQQALQLTVTSCEYKQKVNEAGSVSEPKRASSTPKVSPSVSGDPSQEELEAQALALLSEIFNIYMTKDPAEAKKEIAAIKAQLTKIYGELSDTSEVKEKIKEAIMVSDAPINDPQKWTYFWMGTGKDMHPLSKWIIDVWLKQNPNLLTSLTSASDQMNLFTIMTSLMASNNSSEIDKIFFGSGDGAMGTPGQIGQFIAAFLYQKDGGDWKKISADWNTLKALLPKKDMFGKTPNWDITLDAINADMNALLSSKSWSSTFTGLTPEEILEGKDGLGFLSAWNTFIASYDPPQPTE